MSLSSRLSNGWTIAQNSFKVLKANKQLLLFPILSGASMLLIMASFFVAAFGYAGWDLDNFNNIDRSSNNILGYLFIFVYYIINYFVIVFFNMALIHCATLYFKGEEPTVAKGIAFSRSRIGSILAWSVFAGVIGAILRIVQENLGSLGKIITGIIGIVWSIATFFVVPVIAYENLGPIDALKRSTQMIKEKWGEGLGAGFSFGLIQLVGIIVIAIIGFGLAAVVHPLVGIAAAALCFLLMTTVISAARTIFVSQIYNNVTGNPVQQYDQAFIDSLFVPKRK